MASRKVVTEIANFNATNSDFPGYINMKENEELVSYRQSTSTRIWLNDIPYNFAAHWHSGMEIIMPVENYYDAVCEGIEYHVCPGEILIIPPGVLHELIAPESGKRFIFLMNVGLMARLKGYASLQSMFNNAIYVTKESFPLIYDDVYQILVQIRNEYFKDGEFTEFAIQSLLLNMFVKIGENHNNAEELFPNVRLYKQKEYVQKFNQILEYIDEHFMEDITLEGIADLAGFSKYHFSRLFKQYTDFTFCDYLCYRRIKAAEDFLAMPDYSITEVALQAGFPSISTFNRLFKQQKGCTPSEYRSKNRYRENRGLNAKK